MSRPAAACYEGFRRKTSLSALESGRNAPSLELSLAKLKHNDHLEEVLSLSAQLDSLSKRSFTARPYSDYALAKSHSSSALHDPLDPLSDRRPVPAHPRPEQTGEGSREDGEEERGGEREKREKISSSAIFNKFEVIEEDNYLNEEEVIECIEPVTFKPTPKPAEKKLPPRAHPNKIPQQPAPTPVPARKPAVPSSRVDPLPRKEKLRQDLSEIDKLQREFESKRGVR